MLGARESYRVDASRNPHCVRNVSSFAAARANTPPLIKLNWMYFS